MSPVAALGLAERRILLQLALKSIRDGLDGAAGVRAGPHAADLPGILQGPRGAFVCLKIDDLRGVRHLRGCIGCLEPGRPLYRTVYDCAAASAFADPRFSRVQAEELPRITIEISVLTAPTLVQRADELVPGRDGVRLEALGRTSVFLPQVARERDWDVDEWLGQLALKAGLAREDWKAGTLSSFRAEVFSESVAALEQE